MGDAGTVVDGRFVAGDPTPAGVWPGPPWRRCETAQSGADALPALLGIGEGIGSNSWVVER